MKVVIINACALYFSFFFFLPNDSPLKTMTNAFLFHLKSFFHSRDIQSFVIYYSFSFCKVFFFFHFHTFQIQKGNKSGIIYNAMNWLA